MATALITTGSQLACAHGGSISLSSRQRKLTVDSKSILLRSDLTGKSVPGCGTVNSNTTKQCPTVMSVLGGASAGAVDGVAALTAADQGLTDGIAGGPGTWWCCPRGHRSGWLDDLPARGPANGGLWPRAAWTTVTSSSTTVRWLKSSGLVNLRQGLLLRLETPWASDLLNTGYGLDVARGFHQRARRARSKDVLRLSIVRTLSPTAGHDRPGPVR